MVGAVGIGLTLGTARVNAGGSRDFVGSGPGARAPNDDAHQRNSAARWVRPPWRVGTREEHSPPASPSFPVLFTPRVSASVQIGPREPLPQWRISAVLMVGAVGIEPTTPPV